MIAHNNITIQNHSFVCNAKIQTSYNDVSIVFSSKNTCPPAGWSTQSTTVAVTKCGKVWSLILYPSDMFFYSNIIFFTTN
jgi:hypothetical protein